MQKCPVCNRKAKRACLLQDIAIICSSCCGKTRKEETCHKCSYYKPPQRNYKQVPAYTPSDMDGSFELQDISNVIEGNICRYDHDLSWGLKDCVAIRIIELLLDKYYFERQSPQEQDTIILNGYKLVNDAIEEQLGTIKRDEIIKVLGAIYFVAARRTRGNREYLSIIKRYVGIDSPLGRIMMV